ncbi:tail fiber protein [Vibrio phage VPG01]|nr:tail fiber protein [Vibrio phage VPG01]
MRVDNLQAETTITEQGERVYSPNNKPSASDIGALPATGKAVSASTAETVGSTNLGRTDTAYITIPNAAWYANAPVGRSQMVRSNSFGLPIASAGYVFKFAARDVSKGHGWIYVAGYEGGNSRLFFGTNQLNTEAPKWVEAYSANHKPTAADVGAHPISWKPSWNDVSSKPSTATRWPKWGEISDRPGTMPPSSHTHPWSQITGIPSYATRWPKWSEVAGKPGNLLTQTTADTRYMSKNAKPDANTLDGLNSTDFSRARGSVGTGGGNWTTSQFLDWLDSQGAFAAGHWTMRGSWSYASNKKITDTGLGTILLAGCAIEVFGSRNNCTINIITPTTSSGGVTNATYTYVNNGGGYAPGWRRDYNTRNKPSAAEVGAYSKAEGDARYMYKNGNSFSGDLVSTARNKGLFGVYDSKKTDQIWSMGTAYRNHSSGTNFGNLYGLAYKHTNNKTGGTMAGGHQAVWCENGVPKAAMGSSGLWAAGQVYIGASRHTAWHNGNKPSPQTIGAEPKLSYDRKRKISYGTSNPTGGADGDVYIQYK